MGYHFSEQIMNLTDFDLRTAMRLSSILIGMLSIVLFLLRNSYPPYVRGLTLWASALATIFVAAALLSARGSLPDFFSLFVANSLLMVGFTLLYFGSRQHFNLRVNPRSWIIFGALCMAAIASLPLVTTVYQARAAVMATFLSFALLLHARIIFKHGDKTFAYRYTGVIIGVCGLVCVYRLVSYFFDRTDTHLYEQSLSQIFYVSAFVYGVVLAGLGFTLMASNRVRKELEHLASHDSLTGCLTRRAWLDICGQEMDRSVRTGRQMTILMLDIDHFKLINDKFGHQAGDRVIVSFVNKAVNALRRADSLGRYGGEEFVALLPETDADQALVVAERIRSAVETASDKPNCTVSIGVASNNVKLSVDGLLALADEAMYRAKRDGRNRVVTA
jgi:diguanylate cyclase (GGDEF)-like protein